MFFKDKGLLNIKYNTSVGFITYELGKTCENNGTLAQRIRVVNGIKLLKVALFVKSGIILTIRRLN